MTPRRRAAVRDLRQLAKTMTQAQAAQHLGVKRQWVSSLAQDCGIVFWRQKKSSLPRRCARCNSFSVSKNGTGCLRCKWTPARIKRLRERYGLSQIKMAVEVLRMHVWACMRWESGRIRPAPHTLELLEQVEQNLDQKPRRRATA